MKFQMKKKKGGGGVLSVERWSVTELWQQTITRAPPLQQQPLAPETHINTHSWSPMSTPTDMHILHIYLPTHTHTHSLTFKKHTLAHMHTHTTTRTFIGSENSLHTHTHYSWGNTHRCLISSLSVRLIFWVPLEDTDVTFFWGEKLYTANGGGAAKIL